MSQKLGTFINKENYEFMLVLKEFIESGKVTPVIDRTYPLAEVPEAIRYLEGGHAQGKVVISVSALGNLVLSGDAAKTAHNIVEHEPLFRTIIGGFLIVAILDVVVAWALYVFLRPAGRSIALLAAWLRVVYAAVFAAALGNLIVAMRLLSDADSLKAFGTGQLDAQAIMSVNAFNDGCCMQH